MIMKKDANIPYKIYLSENEIPKEWYNVRADMKNKPAPLLNPGTLQPMTADDLRPVFCDELIAQELDDTTPYSRFHRKFRTSIKCTVLLHWFVHTVWKKSCRHQLRSTTNLKETTQAAATN